MAKTKILIVFVALLLVAMASVANANFFFMLTGRDVTSQPDLIISSAVFTPASPTTSDYFTLDVTVKNNGGASSANSVLSITATGISSYWRMGVDGLAPGTSKTIRISPSQLAAGTYTWTSKADADNGVAEANEDNNILTSTLVVGAASSSSSSSSSSSGGGSTNTSGSSSSGSGGGALSTTTPAPADIIPTTIIFPSTIKEGDSVFFDSGISNIGESDIGLFNVKWFVDNVQVGYGSHTNVPAGQTLLNGNSQYTWVATSGSHTIKFVVNPEPYALESNYSNNAISVTVSAQAKATCNDSDGQNYLVKGTCTDSSGVHADACDSSLMAGDWYCTTAGNCAYISKNCQYYYGQNYGCGDGACTIVQTTPENGTITITSVDNVTGAAISGASVHIGYFRGYTPLILSLEPKEYTVSVSKDGYISDNKVVTINSNQSANFNAKLTSINSSSKSCFDFDSSPNYWRFIISTASEAYPDLYDQGYVNSQSSTSYDSCEGNSIREVFCMSDNTTGTAVIYCPNGCSNGACLKVPVINNTGVVSITSSPSGATAYIDNYYRGSTPLNVNVTAGTHSVKLLYANYNNYLTTIAVYSGQTTNLSAQLIAKQVQLTTCSDTDGGRTEHQQGTVTACNYTTTSGSSCETVTDKCYDSTWLNEYYCGNDNSTQVYMTNCAGGCQNGTCVASTRNVSNYFVLKEYIPFKENQYIVVSKNGKTRVLQFKGISPGSSISDNTGTVRLKDVASADQFDISYAGLAGMLNLDGNSYSLKLSDDTTTANIHVDMNGDGSFGGQLSLDLTGNVGKNFKLQEYVALQQGQDFFVRKNGLSHILTFVSVNPGSSTLDNAGSIRIKEKKLGEFWEITYFNYEGQINVDGNEFKIKVSGDDSSGKLYVDLDGDGLYSNQVSYIEPTSYSCTDSDGGISHNSKGTVNACDPYTGCFSRSDFCSSSSVLGEYYCYSNSSSGFEYVQCASGCSDGVCTSVSSTPQYESLILNVSVGKTIPIPLLQAYHFKSLKSNHQLVQFRYDTKLLYATDIENTAGTHSDTEPGYYIVVPMNTTISGGHQFVYETTLDKPMNLKDAVGQEITLIGKTYKITEVKTIIIDTEPKTIKSKIVLVSNTGDRLTFDGANKFDSNGNVVYNSDESSVIHADLFTYVVADSGAIMLDKIRIYYDSSEKIYVGIGESFTTVAKKVENDNVIDLFGNGIDIFLDEVKSNSSDPTVGNGVVRITSGAKQTEVTTLNNYCGSGSSKECYCNKGEEKVCDAAKELTQAAATRLSNCKCKSNQDDDWGKFDIQIKNGWNLAAPFIFGTDYFVDLEKNTCKNDKLVLYSYFPQERKYGEYVLQPLMIVQEPSTSSQSLLKVSGRLVATDNLRYSIVGKTAADDELLEKYSPFNSGYFTSTSVNSWWIYSPTGCLVTGKINPAYTGKAGLIRELQGAKLKLAKGWNFMAIYPDMLGKTVQEFKGDCTIKRAYKLDKDWININSQPITGEIGEGFIVNVESDCVLGFEDSGGDESLPPLPE